MLITPSTIETAPFSSSHLCRFKDDQLNPVFIVAQYEKETDGEEKINAGGRVCAEIDDKASEVGVTLVRDETVGSKADLAGVDLTYHVTTFNRGAG